MKLGNQMKSTVSEAMSRITESLEKVAGSTQQKEEEEDEEIYSVREAISRDNWKIYQLMSSFFPEDGESQEDSSK